MQPNQARCGLCGARLSAGDEDLSLREIGSLAGSLVLLLGGFIVAAVALIALLLWLLG